MHATSDCGFSVYSTWLLSAGVQLARHLSDDPSRSLLDRGQPSWTLHCQTARSGSRSRELRCVVGSGLFGVGKGKVSVTGRM